VNGWLCALCVTSCVRVRSVAGASNSVCQSAAITSDQVSARSRVRIHMVMTSRAHTVRQRDWPGDSSAGQAHDAAAWRVGMMPRCDACVTSRDVARAQKTLAPITSSSTKPVTSPTPAATGSTKQGAGTQGGGNNAGNHAALITLSALVAILAAALTL
jgi:hypothetical protein